MFHWEVSQLTIMEEVEAFSVIILEKKKNCQPATCARLQMAHKDSLSDTSVVRCFLDVFCRMVLI